ncbi:hypothetical protein AX17_000186 [Amanita inopinata Kibby_2008]|nr:hypothetical protein AX17_000186 [Amanita inopinata Kibby_2008]
MQRHSYNNCIREISDQTITCIAIHPIHPHIFATTSRDHTTRIYDLTLPVRTEEDVQYNPSWPPLRFEPSHAGPAHGLLMDRKEAIGLGRCVVVLMGGRSGGHEAAVLGAAFHRTRPLIATCGLDRAVKIWALPLTIDSPRLVSLNKPLFSSFSIHRARVLSINWLDKDILVSHSAPAILRTEIKDSEDPCESAIEPGQLVLWRWLSLDRFFPPGLPEAAYRQPLRGHASDFGNSSSFKILSVKYIPFPTKEQSQLITPTLCMYVLHPLMQMPDMFILLTNPGSTLTRLMHVAYHFEPHTQPESLSLKLPEKEDTSMQVDGETVDNKSKWGRRPPVDKDELERHMVSGWLVDVDNNSIQQLNACAMTMEGRTIVGVGTKGTLWIWHWIDNSTRSLEHTKN